MTPLWCLLVFVSSALIDYAHARYVGALGASDPHRAGRWSVVQWAGATCGFVIAVKVTFWALPFEAAGLYVGTLLAVARTAKPPATLAQHLSQPIELDRVLAAVGQSTVGRTWS